MTAEKYRRDERTFARCKVDDFSTQKTEVPEVSVKPTNVQSPPSAAKDGEKKVDDDSSDEKTFESTLNHLFASSMYFILFHKKNKKCSFLF